MRARRRTVGSAGQRMPHAHVAAVATAVALFAAGCAGLSSSSQRSLEAGHRAANGGMPSLASAQHRFSAVSARVPAVARLPPVICPEAKAIGGPSTLFIFVGDAVTPEVNATLMRLHELPGDVTFVRMGANSSVVPPLAKFKIIVYWDMVERVVSSPRISATMPNKASCKETAENVRQWFNAQPSRAAVLDGRAASMFLTGELTEGGSRELQSMWQYVAASASGGVVILGGDSSQQGCMRTFMPAIGFTTFRDMVAPDESGIPGDARHEMWMCPQPALHRSSAYWDVFGYPARYAISAFASGGVVPVGTQVNGLFMRGVAYYGGDHTKPAVAVSSSDSAPALRLKLKSSIVSPVDGSYEWAACDGVTLTGEISRESGAPPYELIFTDVTTPTYPIFLGRTVVTPPPPPAPPAPNVTLTLVGGNGTSLNGAAAVNGSVAASGGNGTEAAASPAASPSPSVAPSVAPAASSGNGTAAAGGNATAAAPLRGSITVKLLNGSHTVRLTVRDAEESLSVSDVTFEVSDSITPARAALDAAAALVARTQAALRNVSAAIAATEALTAATRANTAALLKEALAEKRRARAQEATAAALARELGALKGQLRAHAQIVRGRKADIADLSADEGPLLREAADLGSQKKALEEELTESASNAGQVTALQDSIAALKSKESALQAELDALHRKEAAAAATTLALKQTTAGVAANATDKIAAQRAALVSARHRLKEATDHNTAMHADVEATQTKAAEAADRGATIKSHLQIVAAKLRAAQSLASAIAAQGAQVAADHTGVDAATAATHVELDELAAHLGYTDATRPPGLFVPPTIAAPGAPQPSVGPVNASAPAPSTLPSAADFKDLSGDAAESAAGQALAFTAAVEAVARQGVDRSPLAATVAKLEPAVALAAGKAASLRDAVYSAALQETQLKGAVAELGDKVSRLRYDLNATKRAAAGERGRGERLSAHLEHIKASMQHEESALAAAREEHKATRLAAEKAAAAVGEAAARKESLQREIVRWNGMADDMDEAAKVKAEREKQKLKDEAAADAAVDAADAAAGDA